VCPTAQTVALFLPPSLHAANGELAEQTMTGVHAALQDYVKTQCELAGKPVYKLMLQPGYDMVYSVYCSKGNSREVGNISAPVYMAPVTTMCARMTTT
jgi:hypothetical protein